MGWDIEYTDEFGVRWNSLSEEEQDRVAVSVGLLNEHGPNLPSPHSSAITTSKHSHMRELRIQHAGHPYRVLYAFDPLRSALLLIGGNKTGDNRCYQVFFPLADRLYDDHLLALKKEGKI